MMNNTMKLRLRKRAATETVTELQREIGTTPTKKLAANPLNSFKRSNKKHLSLPSNLQVGLLNDRDHSKLQKQVTHIAPTRLSGNISSCQTEADEDELSDKENVGCTQSINLARCESHTRHTQESANYLSHTLDNADREEPNDIFKETLSGGSNNLPERYSQQQDSPSRFRNTNPQSVGLENLILINRPVVHHADQNRSRLGSIFQDQELALKVVQNLLDNFAKKCENKEIREGIIPSLLSDIIRVVEKLMWFQNVQSI